jgi:hypothetical protein
MTTEPTKIERTRVYRPVSHEMLRIACGWGDARGIMRAYHSDLLIDFRTLEEAKPGDHFVWLVREAGTQLMPGRPGDPDVTTMVTRMAAITCRFTLFELIVHEVKDRDCYAEMHGCTAYNDLIDWSQDHARREA